MAHGSSADDDRLAVRRAEAIKLRMQGLTFREIADKLGISYSVAHHDVRLMLEEVGNEARDHAAAARGLELNRLDRFQREVDAVLQSETNPELRMKAVDRGVRVSERRAKLQGLDAPVKQEIAAAIVAESPKAIAARARELMNATFPGSVGPLDDDEEAPDPERDGAEPTEPSST